MAQPTRCDGHVGCRRLRHNNLRRTQWRRRLRAGRRKPRRSGRFFEPVAGCSGRAPLFFELSLSRDAVRAGTSPRSEAADIRADVPGGRVRRVVRRNARNPQPPKGGIRDGEEGQRRQKEGGEEEITSAVRHRRGRADARPLFCVRGYRLSVTPSQIRTRRITSVGTRRSTTSMPSTTCPNTV